MSYLDNALVHAETLVSKLKELIAKEKGLVEKEKVIEAIGYYYNSLHSWQDADLPKLIDNIRKL